MLQTDPAVFAVGREYQIMVAVKKNVMVWIQVGNELYYDDSNGIMRSSVCVHRVCVPTEKLDSYGEYTLFVRPVLERKANYTITQEPQSYIYPFHPLPEDHIRIFQIADAHERIEEPVKCAENFGDIDLLILNGDLLNNSNEPSMFLNLYKLCSQICGGRKPVIFSRGNHDLRGVYAEHFAEYAPGHLGQSYYSFRLGSLWGLVLDCGEDKEDNNEEYGNTAAFHQFRKKETAFIDRIISECAKEYDAEGVRHRLVISHIPFTRVDKEPFDIEQDIYSTWVQRLREHIHPELILCGHTHCLKVVMPGDELDHFNQPCPVIIGSRPTEDSYTASGLTLSVNTADVVFVDNLGNAERHTLSLSPNRTTRD